MLLPEESADVVERFVQWLYSKGYELSEYATARGADTRYRQLAELYVFADKYDVINLKHNVIDQFFETRGSYMRVPSLSVVTYAYDNSTKMSSFRKLLVAWCCMRLDWYHTPGIRCWLERNAEFAADIAIALAKTKLCGIPTHDPSSLGRPDDYYEASAKATQTLEQQHQLQPDRAPMDTYRAICATTIRFECRLRSLITGIEN